MNIFGFFPERKKPRSKKNMSHTSVFDLGFGRCIPCNCEEATSNDYFAFSHSQYIQPVPMLKPAFANIKVRTRTFAVPFHLLYGYSYLEQFLSDSTGQLKEPYTTIDDLLHVHYKDVWDDEDSEDPIEFTPLSNYGLCDFFNLPTVPAGLDLNLSTTLKDSPLLQEEVSIIKAMSYLKVWNDWYRDENYQKDLQFIIDAIQEYPSFPYIPYTANVTGDDGATYYLLEEIFRPRFASVGKDYFMGVLPFQQASDPIRLPVGDKAEIFGEDVGGVAEGPNGMANLEIAINDYTDMSFGNSTSDYTNKFALKNIAESDRGVNLYADLSKAYGIDIIQFRSLQAAQRWSELNARGGRRLPEILRARFNSRVPDAFIPRSIYIGGSVESVKIDSIYQTASTEQGSLGDYAGRAYAAGQSPAFGYHSLLPSMLITIQTVLPEPFYFQGIRKDNQRLTVFDKINPEFARIGEQPVLSKEFFVPFRADLGALFDPDSIFGYVPRYSDWMVHLNEMHGSFRDSKLPWSTVLVLQAYGYPADGHYDVPVDDPNVEQQELLLNQGFYRQANRIFNYTPEHENDARPFNSTFHIKMTKVTALPHDPSAII